MPLTKAASLDILLVALIILSISVSAITISQIVSGQSASMFAMNTSNELDHAQSPDRADEGTRERELAPSGSGTYGGGAMVVQETDGQLGSGSAYLSPITESSVYGSTQYILPISWGAVVGTLIWRGRVRSSWCKQGYDYDTFRLVARTKGSPTRVKLLNSVATAKNRLQLADELDVDWKTVDNHMSILTRNGLVEEKAIVGTTRYYVLTEHGRRILLLLSEAQGSGVSNQEPVVGAPVALNATR